MKKLLRKKLLLILYGPPLASLNAVLAMLESITLLLLPLELSTSILVVQSKLLNQLSGRSLEAPAKNQEAFLRKKLLASPTTKM